MRGNGRMKKKREETGKGARREGAKIQWRGGERGGRRGEEGKGENERGGGRGDGREVTEVR